MSGQAVRKNKIAATCAAEGSYDEVHYCSKCEAEMSRVFINTPKTNEHSFAEDGYCTL